MEYRRVTSVMYITMYIRASVGELGSSGIPSANTAAALQRTEMELHSVALRVEDVQRRTDVVTEKSAIYVFEIEDVGPRSRLMTSAAPHRE